MAGRVGVILAIAGSLLAVALVVRTNTRASEPRVKANLAFTLEDMNGAKIDLASYAGKPLIINLWATWCGPCRLEMPQLVELAAKFKDRGLQVIGISVDDNPADIREFAAEYKVTYPMLVGLGQDALLHALGYEDSVPISVLIRADGSIASVLQGITTTDDWEKRINGLF
ncbi:MAG TPA: TlpA disulfide reductase family protein [Vicinamibacterales bacterium]|nr:TlpA disulfide reductase family protein [Vicinamibacterales bacterium]